MPMRIIIKSQVNLSKKTNLVIFNKLREGQYIMLRNYKSYKYKINIIIDYN